MAETAKLVEDGVARIQAAGSDVVLVDPQYSPRVNEKAENASKMIKVLDRVAELRKVGIFPRFEVMRDWHEKQSIPIETFVIADGLHMNDWGYACFAQLLGDDIIRSVGQIKLGVTVPTRRADVSADVSLRRPGEAKRELATIANSGLELSMLSHAVVTLRFAHSASRCLTPSPAPAQNPRSDRRHARARPRSG